MANHQLPHYGTIIKTTPFSEIHLPHHRDPSLKIETINERFSRVEDLLQELQRSVVLIQEQQEIQTQDVENFDGKHNEVEDQFSSTLENLNKDLKELKENINWMQGSLEQVEEQLDEWEKFIQQQEQIFLSSTKEEELRTEIQQENELRELAEQKKNETAYVEEFVLVEEEETLQIAPAYAELSRPKEEAIIFSAPNVSNWDDILFQDSEKIEEPDSNAELTEFKTQQIEDKELAPQTEANPEVCNKTENEAPLEETKDEANYVAYLNALAISGQELTEENVQNLKAEEVQREEQIPAEESSIETLIEPLKGNELAPQTETNPEACSKTENEAPIEETKDEANYTAYLNALAISSQELTEEDVQNLTAEEVQREEQIPAEESSIETLIDELEEFKTKQVEVQQVVEESKLEESKQISEESKISEAETSLTEGFNTTVRIKAENEQLTEELHEVEINQTEEHYTEIRIDEFKQVSEESKISEAETSLTEEFNTTVRIKAEDEQFTEKLDEAEIHQTEEHYTEIRIDEFKQISEESKFSEAEIGKNEQEPLMGVNQELSEEEQIKAEIVSVLSQSSLAAPNHVEKMLKNRPIKSSLEHIDDDTVSSTQNDTVQPIEIPDNPFEIPGVNTDAYMPIQKTFSPPPKKDKAPKKDRVLRKDEAPKNSSNLLSEEEQIEAEIISVLSPNNTEPENMGGLSTVQQNITQPIEIPDNPFEIPGVDTSAYMEVTMQEDSEVPQVSKIEMNEGIPVLNINTDELLLEEDEEFRTLLNEEKVYEE